MLVFYAMLFSCPGYEHEKYDMPGHMDSCLVEMCLQKVAEASNYAEAHKILSPAPRAFRALGWHSALQLSIQFNQELTEWRSFNCEGAGRRKVHELGMCGSMVHYAKQTKQVQEFQRLGLS